MEESFNDNCACAPWMNERMKLHNWIMDVFVSVFLPEMIPQNRVSNVMCRQTI